MKPANLKGVDLSKLKDIGNEEVQAMAELTESERIFHEWDIQNRPTVYPVPPTPPVLAAARAKVGMQPSSPSKTNSLPTVGWQINLDTSPIRNDEEPPQKRARVEPAWKTHLERRKMLEKEREEQGDTRSESYSNGAY